MCHYQFNYTSASPLCQCAWGLSSRPEWSSLPEAQGLPVHLCSKLGDLGLGLSKDGNVPDYRFEIPLRVAWMWEPSPRFSIGPYAGVYGVWNFMVVPDDETAYNTLQGGFSAGVSIRFGALDLYGGYWRDFLPFRKGGSPFSGWRVTLAYFM